MRIHPITTNLKIEYFMSLFLLELHFVFSFNREVFWHLSKISRILRYFRISNYSTMRVASGNKYFLSLVNTKILVKKEKQMNLT